MDPIEVWHYLVNKDLPENEMEDGLRRTYVENPPYVAEAIVNSYCPNRCLHCIYPPDFHISNKNMGIEKWKIAFNLMYEELGFKRFVFDGRGLCQDIIDAINHIKDQFNDVKVGLITDGVSAEPFLEKLLRLPLDWIDISVDGLENDHDTQRGCKGAFRKTLRMLHELKDSGRFERVNILTCLTTINASTILKMIAFLNTQGFKNFFMTPVSTLDGYPPNPELKLVDESFMAFIDKLLLEFENFSDTWLEVGIYEATYAKAIKRLSSDLFGSLAMEYDHLEFTRAHKDNEVHICYYPSSLTGTRELILNSNGNLIPPKVVAMGDIPSEFSFGNILNEKPNILRRMAEEDAFSFYISELIEEKTLLG